MIKAVRTSHFLVKNARERSILLSCIMATAHFQNMLILLIAENYRAYQAGLAKNYRDSFLNKRIVRAILTGAPGGLLEEKIKELKTTFESSPLFQQLIAVGSNLKEKNIAQLVGKLKSAFKSYFTKYKRGTVSAKPPHTKKLSYLRNFSIPIDQCAFSLKKKDRLRINLGRKMQDFHLDHENLLKLVGDLENIQSLELVLKYDQVYFSLTYLAATPKEGSSLTPEKAAGLDLGLKNTAAIVVDDQSTTSLVISGSKLIAFNQSNNLKLDQARSQEKLAANKVESRKQEIRQAEGLDYLSSADFTSRGIDCLALQQWYHFKRERVSKLYQKRHHFFKDSFHKLASRILEYLRLAQVTTLYVSKNLAEAKQKKGLSKEFNKKFHPIPLIKLIDYLILKAGDYGIKVEEVDEAYTSKCSCISGDVQQAQSLKNAGLRPRQANVFKGRRVCRSQFRDSMIQATFLADLNAACNHILVGRKDRKPLMWLQNHLAKLTRPLVCPCDSLFLDCSLNRDITKLKDPLRRTYAAQFLNKMHI